MSDFDLFARPTSESSESEKIKKQTEKQIASAYKAVFSTTEGKIVLNHIKNATLDRPVLQAYHTDGMNTAMFMAWREGANYVARTILQYSNQEED